MTVLLISSMLAFCCFLFARKHLQQIVFEELLVGLLVLSCCLCLLDSNRLRVTYAYMP